MKRLLITVIALSMMLALSSTLRAQSGTEISAIPFSRTPYQIGEQLTYHVSFSNFVDAAHVQLLVAGRGTYFMRDGLQLRAHVETTGVVNAALYSVNNDYTAYIDPESGIPFRTQRVIREAGRTSDTSSEYNQPVGTSAIPPKLRMGEFPGMYDFLSALYRLRALPLVQGAKYYFNVRSDTQQFDAELRVTNRQLIKTNVGSFNAIVTEVRVPKNSEANNYHVRIYFSDDERHVPVLITANPRAGEIRAELAGSEFITQTPQTATPTATPTPTPPVVNNQTNGTQLRGGLPFQAGEQLNYNVFLGASTQPVATVSSQIRPRAKYFNRDGILFAVKAQTLAAIGKLFFANDQINSYVDPQRLLPFRTELNLVEGRRRTNQVLTYDQDRGSVLTDRGTRIEIPVGTHDYISAIYALRLFNLAPSKRNAVTMLVNNRPLTLIITSLKRETIQLGGQQIPAIQLSLTTDDPQPDKYALRLWVSDDRRRLPLRVTAITPIGPVRADLIIMPTAQQ